MGWGRPAPLRCELNLLGRPCGAGWVNKDIALVCGGVESGVSGVPEYLQFTGSTPKLSFNVHNSSFILVPVPAENLPST